MGPAGLAALGHSGHLISADINTDGCKFFQDCDISFPAPLLQALEPATEVRGTWIDAVAENVQEKL